MKIDYSLKIDIVFNDKILCSSTLFDYDDYMDIVSMFVDPGFHIPEGRSITLFFYSIGGIRSYCKATTLKAFPGKVNVKLDGKITTENERRRAIKIKAEPMLKSTLFVNGIPSEIIIKDISETGVFLAYEDELDIGHKCAVTINDLGTSAIAVKIVRRHFDNSGYGGEFCDIIPSDSQKISAYIYARQIQELNEIRKKNRFHN